MEKDGERIIKCDCSREFGDYRENWKLKALIDVIETEEDMDKLYPGLTKPDVKWCEVRKYYCPGCVVQLKVETVPRGYPIIFDFLPDIDAFYSDWLNRPLSAEKEFKDLTYDYMEREGWGK